MDRGTDPCRQKFHLFVPVAGAIIETEQFRPSIFGYSGPDHRHQVFVVILIKQICPDKETAGIIDQGNNVDAFFSFRRRKVWPKTGISIPDLINMRTFIAVHLFFRHCFLFRPEMPDKSFYGGDGHLSCAETSVADQLPVDFRSWHTGIF